MLLTTKAPRRIIPPCSISFWVFVCISLSLYESAGTTPLTWRAPVNSRSSLASGLSMPISSPAGPAGLLHQPHAEDLHPPVGGLHHIVYRQQRDGDRRQRFHLHSGLAHDSGRRAHADARELLVQTGLDLYVVERDRVAQRDQLRRPLRRQRSRDLAHRQHVAFGNGLVGDETERVRRHPDRSPGHRGPGRNRLIAHVHHAGSAGRVHMTQLHPASAKSSDRTAVRSWGFTFPCAISRAAST